MMRTFRSAVKRKKDAEILYEAALGSEGTTLQARRNRPGDKPVRARNTRERCEASENPSWVAMALSLPLVRESNRLAHSMRNRVRYSFGGIAVSYENPWVR